jgi:hypothetical protein
MLCAGFLDNLEPLASFQVALAPEPVFHGREQAIERNAMPGFEHSVCGREGIVEDGVVGEIAHGKAVDVPDGAGMALTSSIDALDREAPRKHGFTVQDTAPRRMLWRFI